MVKDPSISVQQSVSLNSNDSVKNIDTDYIACDLKSYYKNVSVSIDSSVTRHCQDNSPVVCNSSIKTQHAVFSNRNNVVKESNMDFMDTQSVLADNNFDNNTTQYDNTLCADIGRSNTYVSDNCVKTQKSAVGASVQLRVDQTGVVKNTCNNKSNNKDSFSYTTVLHDNVDTLKRFPHEIKGANKPVDGIFQSNPQQQFIQENSSLSRDSSTTDYLNVVSKITASGLPNYKSEKIPLESNFNINLWRSKLKDYHDKHLVNLLKFGFPLGIQNRDKLYRGHIDNHTSAREFTPHVADFICKELDYGALLGPFSSKPHPEFHCSPLLTRPKDIDKRRVIVDLFFGAGDTVKQATSKYTYEDIAFTLQLDPTLDHVLDQIMQLRDPAS